MDNYIEELKYYKRERDRIKSEINDLKSRIVVESGRHNRYEVNNYRDRINRLKMKLDEVSLKIVELENKIKQEDSLGQIQVVPDNELQLPSIKNGDITISDTLVFDCGSDMAGDIIQTVTRTIERTIKFKNGQPTSSIEHVNETVQIRKLKSEDIFIESSTIS